MARTRFLYPLARRGPIIGRPYQGTHTLGNWQSDNAVDISVPVGTPVYAVENARISKVTLHPDDGGRFAGDQVTIAGRDSFFYTHLKSVVVKAGQLVKRGQLLGYSGSASGVAHLHFGEEHGSPLSLVNAPIGKGTTTARPRKGRPTADGPADWLKQAGWPSNLIPTMIAIGWAESGLKVDAVSPPNTNGTVDRGWLQVNSVHGADPARLTSDPVYTARIAYGIYKSQGLGAWSTYNNGAYKAFLGKSPTGPTFSRPRPGGQPAGDNPDGGPDSVLAAYWGGADNIDASIGIPGIGLPGLKGGLPNPLDLFKSAGKSITATADFFKWIAWIFHPLNILRIVEFQVGFPMIGFGIWILIQEWKGADSQAPFRLIGEAASFTPVGRGVRVAKGVRTGKGLAKTAAKREETAKAVKRGRKQQTQKISDKRLKREARKDTEPVPF